MGISKSEYLKKYTDWGKAGLTREEFFKREGLTEYTWKKLKIAQRVLAEQERELNKAAATKAAADKATADKAAAAAAASASRERGKGTKRTQADDDDDEDDDDDDSDSSDSSDGRDGAPSTDSDADYAP